MRTYLALGLALATAALSGACDGSDTEIGSERGSAGYDDYVAELSELLCESGASCCGPNFMLAECRQVLPFLAERPDADKIAFHADLAEQCLAEVRVATACADTPDVCYRVVEGLVAPGAICETSLECASDGQFLSGGRCDEPETGSRRCRGSAALGEACDGTCSRDVCFYIANGQGGLCPEQQGLRCGMTSGVCEAIAPQGAPCIDDTSCAAGFECNGSTCVPLPGVGEPCVLFCSEGSYCSAGTCVPTVPVGGACTNPAECAGGGCVNGACNATGFVCFFFGGGA